MSPDKTFQELINQKPDIALGLGYATGLEPPTVIARGPLWRGTHAQVGPEARWHIGSITKSVTATAALQQYDRSRLDLDQPIADLLRDTDTMDATWRALTLRQLLSHTGGIPANPPLWQFRKWRTLDAVPGRRKVLEAAWSRPIKGKPGKFCYSNLGYMLVGHVLEEITSDPWETIVKKHVAAPLGLNSIGFGAPVGDADPKGHRRSFFRWWPAEPDNVGSDNPSWLGPAGTLHMSIPDLLAFGRAHLQAAKGASPHFLSKKSSEMMRMVVSDEYGLGWVVQKDVAWHNGSNTMWYAVLAIDPENDSVVAVTQNAMTRTSQIDALLRDTVHFLRQR